VNSANAIEPLGQLDTERVSRPDSLLDALRRRYGGHYPIDPFGLDAQIADAVQPLFKAAIRVRVVGDDTVPKQGPAVVVANRGLGAVEPIALGLAVLQATGRRLRNVGAPRLPFIGAAARRLGAIAGSEHDVLAALHAGHLVGVPLAPSGLRIHAGDAPAALATALTHSPIVPAAVVPRGRIGALTGSWEVRFGSLVTLPDPYDPRDPLTAGRFADAMQDAVAALLASLTNS
jgi:1-acyl-sn-glycerol-3-phosphate acyltransferase